MSIVKTLKTRWRPEWSSRPDLRKLSGAFHKTLSLIESLPAEKRTLAKPGDLSPKGLNEAIRRVAAERVVPDLRRSAWECEKARNGIRNERMKLAVPAPDKSDIAGALLRQEIRTFLRGVDHGARIAAVISDRAFLEAAMEGPAALSGLTDDMRVNLQDRLIDQAHGAAVAAMNETKEAVELVEAAIEVAVNVVRAEGDFASDEQFDSWMKSASAAVEREIATEKAPLVTAIERVIVKPDDDDAIRAHFAAKLDAEFDRILAA